MKLLLRFFYCLVGGIGIGVGFGVAAMMFSHYLRQQIIDSPSPSKVAEAQALDYLKVRDVTPNLLVKYPAVRVSIENQSETHDYSSIQAKIILLRDGDEVLKCPSYGEDEIKAKSTETIYLVCSGYEWTSHPTNVQYQFEITSAYASEAGY